MTLSRLQSPGCVPTQQESLESRLQAEGIRTYTIDRLHDAFGKRTVTIAGLFLEPSPKKHEGNLPSSPIEKNTRKWQRSIENLLRDPLIHIPKPGAHDGLWLYLSQACKEEPLTVPEERALLTRMWNARESWCANILGEPEILERTRDSLSAVQRDREEKMRRANDVHRIRMYQKQIGVIEQAHKLLANLSPTNADDVRIIMTKIPELESWMQDAEHYLTTHRPETTERLAQWKSAWLRERDALIRRNTRLVVSIVKQYRRPQGGYEICLELIQEGNLGCIRAADLISRKFDVKFSTYAHWWIQNYILRFLYEKQSIISSTVAVLDDRKKIEQFAKKYRETHGCLPSEKEIVKACGLSKERADIVRQRNGVISIDREVGEGEESFASVFLEDAHALEPSDLLAEQELRGVIEQCLLSITPEQRRALIDRFGLGFEEGLSADRIPTLQRNEATYGKDLSLDASGKRQGVTREAIRQQERKALESLHNPDHPAHEHLLAFRDAIDPLGTTTNVRSMTAKQNDPRLNMSIADLDWHHGTRTSMFDRGIFTVGQLIEHLQGNEKFEKRMLRTIQEGLNRIGISMKEAFNYDLEGT